MIKTEAQYNNTKKLIKQFESSIANLVDSSETNEFKQLEIAGLKSQLEDLTKEICEYEALKSGHIRSILVEDLTQVYKILIQARIANGLTQKQLAIKLGVAEQQIQRWEANDYDSISFGTMQEILLALNITIPVGRTSLTPVSFNLQGADQELILSAEVKVALRGKLLYL
jgi:HTH-type transcriptional regulator/antitoxin HigA